MIRIHVLLLGAVLALAACAASSPQMGPDGKPLPRVYRISPGETREVRFRMLDAVNSLREGAGVKPLILDNKLTAAAATHSRDMSVQERPWHFGSDGSSPLDRIQRVEYEGEFIGETISETYETELETLAAWMEDDVTRRVILSSEARRMGFAWHQDPGGKIWWTMTLGS
ncbi:CAP domain-containing protein [Roseovarius ramblicola]|uniref:CAP domain-containing protein n=1 Tax=Roseovarius ramblicola TaxID=2022336 RepID=A0ABV5HXI5_9RHOB